MATNDEVLEFIEHAIAPQRYDPAKARDYYLRTRKLKGRSPAASKSSPSRPSAKAQPLKISNKKIKKVSVPSKAMQANASLRVASIKKKLVKLKSLLAKLIQKAKNSDKGSADKSKKKDSGDSSANSRKESSDLTTSQKNEKAKKARDDYEKVDKKPGDSESRKKDIDAQIKDVRAQIAKIQKELKAATAKARSTSKTKKK